MSGLNGTDLLVAVALAAVLAFAQLLDGHVRYSGASRRVQGARWAKRRDLQDLLAGDHRGGRLVLGRYRGRLLRTAEQASVVIVGPSRIAHKTTGFTIPAVLEWDGPVVVTSVKSDLVLATIGHRRTLGGRTMVFDPTGATGLGTVKATPLSACGSWRGSMRVAHLLSASARSGSGGLENSSFWFAAAEKLLAPLLFAAAISEGEMADVVRWLDGGATAEPEVSELLQGSKCPEAVNAWRANWNRDERQRSSIYTTAETIVNAFADPRVLEASSRADYTPAALLDGRPNTLYLCAPAHEQERLRSLFAAMLSELVGVVEERSARTGKPIDPPLLMVLDEAANTAPLPELDVVASTGAGQGIQLVTVFQDFSQGEARWGKQAATILNNHQAKVFAPGISDPETLRYVNAIVGEAEFRQRSETAAERGRGSSTEGTTYRALTPPNVVREGNPGSALLIYGHRPPARIELRPWFEDRQLSSMVERGGR